MSKPIRYVYYTPAGPIELFKTEEEIEKEGTYYSITRPAEGRPRYVAALNFMLREKLDNAAAEDWFYLVDADGIRTTLRPSAISGFRILEPIGGPPSDEPQIGFRLRGEPPTRPGDGESGQWPNSTRRPPWDRASDFDSVARISLSPLTFH